MRNNSNNSRKIQFNVFLVRHGETNENKSGIIQGQSDTLLSDIGVEQSKRVGTRLAHLKFKYIYSSDLTRAFDTATHLLSENSHGEYYINRDKLLRERKFGLAEGTKRKDLIELAAKHGKTTTDYVPKGAETTFQVRSRAVEFFETLCKNYRLNQVSSKLSSIECTKIEVKLKEDIPFPYENSLGSSYNSLEEEIQNSRVGNESPSSSVSDYLTKINQIDDNIHADCSQTDNNILIVSHGAFIREMLKYFFNDLRCELPSTDDKYTLKEVPANTSISKFTVTLAQNDKEMPKIVCHLLSDKAHLTDTNLDVKNLCSL